MSRYMSKSQVVADFVDVAYEAGARFPKGDMIGWRMAWSEHLDRLCREGYISPKNCERGWVAPRSIPRILTMTRRSR